METSKAVKYRVKKIELIVTPFKGKRAVKKMELKKQTTRQRIIFENLGCMILDLSSDDGE